MPLRHHSLRQLEQKEDFIDRHIGPDQTEIDAMLHHLEMPSLDALIEKAVPQNILAKHPLNFERCKNESDALARLKEIATQNVVAKSYIGMGYTGCITPPVIGRNILENPSWYTAYTPYQAEISQGRLEGLINYQTMITDLTGMEIANASLLDEGTAAAEAMAMTFNLQRKKLKGRTTFWVMDDVHPQTLEVLQTRAEPIGVTIESGPLAAFNPEGPYFGILLQYPGSSGQIHELEDAIKAAQANKMLVSVTADLLSLCLLKPPGEMNADVVVGSAQRFGVPMGFGGPHAAFFATREQYKRAMPGRIVSVSKDSAGKPAYRLALQTREQHIRREKATSNICTSQVLLAVIAGMYAVYHGPLQLRRIALRVHRFSAILAKGLKQLGYENSNGAFFDTTRYAVDAETRDAVRARALAKNINFRYYSDNSFSITLDETTRREDIAELFEVVSGNSQVDLNVDELFEGLEDQFPEALVRTSSYLDHPVFNTHHSETEMLRYLHALAGKDLSLTHSMIPLGSCTMKLNATAEMIPITWPELANMHPFAPADQAKGYATLIGELEGMLAEITGLPGVSLQPNAGSQGEYAGLLTIRRYHQSNGQGHRNICIIPSSAHGTNPASAVMAGMKVVVVGCDEKGNIDIADLAAKAEKHREDLAALMITYPSTHGVFEEGITEICAIIHDNGGQVYMDGANMNALVGLARPIDFGADVLHLNLHKTFCIPHGGGGPGVGPIAAAAHLKPFLPGHGQRDDAFPETNTGAVSAAPWGSAGILPISWAYIAMMGRGGLKRATQVAILNANYIAQRLEDHFPILYRGLNDLIAHECIVDVRPLKNTAGVDVEDIAKRLMDYGFHAPTMSWPVAGTLMIEPTESESKAELDRFCDAMIEIRKEIEAIEKGSIPAEESPLKNAPHTAAVLVAAEWDRPYSRQEAVFPLAYVAANKFWPSVGRIDNAYGDKNLMCSCIPVEEYA
ncbi:aminomethyl-transferring glycine dehydrogenase [Acanthopleuribacter pedis]|uniref:Glycine dehydrogenase (decarboxylating) n=1 Tax=Acanthopleuribacter pedis TaxID=442870 RepID=A0A8J7Q471_9BACT|nr:aminomethyl-transferring glycine dehydrogenase [Acanthopleuribacter pedis]MBO1317742.1 aminomethyl-transferring glycine dehydrogenase [Acanthopleuribacter pedis]